MIEIAKSLAAQIASRADEADRNHTLPVEDVQLLKESGYFAMPIPVAYGGMGLSLRDCTAAHLELSQGSASTAMLATMPLQVLGDAFETDNWSEAHKAQFSHAVIHEGAVFNVAASEPIMGSPSRGAFYESRAVREGDHWILNGHKTWITGGQHITHLLIKLIVEDQPGTILVLQNTPNLRWELTWKDALSLRASDSHDLYLENVRVPADHLVEYGERKVKHPNAWFAILIGTVYLGSAVAARNAVIKYALERVPAALGKPIATLPKIQRQIGELDVMLQAARALLFEVTADWSTYPEHRVQLYPRIAAAKHHVVETALQVTELALKIAGGTGITGALPLARYLRDVQAGSMQPPSGDTALEIVGRGAIENFNP